MKKKTTTHPDPNSFRSDLSRPNPNPSLATQPRRRPTRPLSQPQPRRRRVRPPLPAPPRRLPHRGHGPLPPPPPPSISSHLLLPPRPLSHRRRRTTATASSSSTTLRRQRRSQGRQQPQPSLLAGDPILEDLGKVWGQGRRSCSIDLVRMDAHQGAPP